MYQAVDGRRVLALMVRREDVLLSIFEEERFAELPARLAQSLGARSTIFHWIHRDGGYEAVGFCHFTPEWMRGYAQTWARVDPWYAAGQSSAHLNKLFRLHQVVPERVFINSAIYNDYIRTQGDDTLHAMGGAFQTAWGIGMVAVHRGRRVGAFEEADVHKFQKYNRALHRLLRVKGELAAARREGQQAKGALDALAYGIMILSPDGRVLSVNGVAERVMKRADGLISRRGVVCTGYGQDAQLQAAITRAAALDGPVATSLFIYRGEDQPPYLATICPVIESGAVMIIFCDPDVEDASLAARLQRLYSLTRAEAAVAIDLSKGKTVAIITRDRGVSANTLKTQLASTMQKMRCNRQAEVAAIVAGLPPLTAP